MDRYSEYRSICVDSKNSWECYVWSIGNKLYVERSNCVLRGYPNWLAKIYNLLRKTTKSMFKTYRILNILLTLERPSVYILSFFFSVTRTPYVCTQRWKNKAKQQQQQQINSTWGCQHHLKELDTIILKLHCLSLIANILCHSILTLQKASRGSWCSQFYVGNHKNVTERGTKINAPVWVHNNTFFSIKKTVLAITHWKNTLLQTFLQGLNYLEIYTGNKFALTENIPSTSGGKTAS